MRASIWIGTVAITGFGVWHFVYASGPGVSQVEPLLRSYLESEHDCAGSLDVESLENVSVGRYTEAMGGWPVYADHVEVCRTHDAQPYASTTTATYDGSHDAERRVAAAFARRTPAGGFELYEPVLLEAGQRDMQRAMRSALDGIRVN